VEFCVLGFWRVRVLTRGKRWSADEERMLEQFVKAGVPAFEIAKRLGKSVVGVHNKTAHLGLEDDNGKGCVSSSSSSSLSTSTPEAKVEASSVTKVLPVEGSDAKKPLSEPSSPVLVWPEALDSPHDAIRTLSVAVRALQQPGLGRNEIQRLKGIILGTEKFQGAFDWVANSRRLEERLVDLEGKYFELVKKPKTAPNDESS